MSLNNYLLVSSNYNRVILRRRQRTINRLIHQRQGRRIVHRRRTVHRRRVTVNNADTLNRISQLPLQFSSDPLVNQMFNGSLFC